MAGPAPTPPGYRWPAACSKRAIAVLYDLHGHGASSLGMQPLTMEMLADELASVLDAYDITDAVLSGHSMGGITISMDSITIMSLATHRSEVLNARIRALVLVSTAVANQSRGSARVEQFGDCFIASSLLTRAMRTHNGHRLVRIAFGGDPVRAHMELSRGLFAGTDGAVRVGRDLWR